MTESAQAHILSGNKGMTAGAMTGARQGSRINKGCKASKTQLSVLEKKKHFALLQSAFSLPNLVGAIGLELMLYANFIFLILPLHSQHFLFGPLESCVMTEKMTEFKPRFGLPASPHLMKSSIAHSAFLLLLCLRAQAASIHI